MPPLNILGGGGGGGGGGGALAPLAPHVPPPLTYLCALGKVKKSVCYTEWRDEWMSVSNVLYKGRFDLNLGECPL